MDVQCAIFPYFSCSPPCLFDCWSSRRAFLLFTHFVFHSFYLSFSSILSGNNRHHLGPRLTAVLAQDGAGLTSHPRRRPATVGRALCILPCCCHIVPSWLAGLPPDRAPCHVCPYMAGRYGTAFAIRKFSSSCRYRKNKITVR